MKSDTGTNDEIGVAVEIWLYIYIYIYIFYIYSLEKILLLALVGHPSSGGVTIKMSYEV